jgi:DNA polymerase III delta prime subunit
MSEQFLWVEKYRPKTIADCVLPEDIKNVFQKFVNDRFVPNLLLSGGPGVGKTTVALAMLNELNCDSIIFNGSLNVDKDSLRNDIQNYASTVSLMGGRKYIIIDEADYLNVTHVQPALRRFLEEFAGNCGFILTCNYKNKIIQPLHSRFSVIDFKINNKQKAELATKFLDRCCFILDQEKVMYDKKVIAEIIMKYFPDWRRVLNELQRYSAQSNGKIDVGILTSLVDTDIKDLLDALKKKDFMSMRKWVGANSTVDIAALFNRLYTIAYEHLNAKSVPQLVLILGKYQYQAAFVVDQEINLAACMTEIMVDCEFK